MRKLLRRRRRTKRRRRRKIRLISDRVTELGFDDKPMIAMFPMEGSSILHTDTPRFTDGHGTRCSGASRNMLLSVGVPTETWLVFLDKSEIL